MDLDNSINTIRSKCLNSDTPKNPTPLPSLPRPNRTERSCPFSPIRGVVFAVAAHTVCTSPVLFRQGSLYSREGFARPKGVNAHICETRGFLCDSTSMGCDGDGDMGCDADTDTDGSHELTG